MILSRVEVVMGIEAKLEKVNFGRSKLLISLAFVFGSTFRSGIIACQIVPINTDKGIELHQ